jgi:transcriptional repressor NrdR
VVIKNNNVRELFNREKLLAGLNSACEKTSVTNIQLENLVSNIEQSLYDTGEPEVSSSQIGKLVMEELSLLNEVAYVRFASVYRRFKSIAGFEKELLDIRKRKK